MLTRVFLALVVVAAACSSPADDDLDSSAPTANSAPAESRPLLDSDGESIPDGPVVPTGPLTEEALAAIEAVWLNLATGIDPEDLALIGSLGDSRLAWLLSDVVRFIPGGIVGQVAVEAFTELTTVELPLGSLASDWRAITDLLIAWDVPAPPGYAKYKERLFVQVEPGWAPFFADAAADVDWRLVSWGGVLIDDRPLGSIEPCPRGCIPALDDPPVTDAAGGSWYPDDEIVFGVSVNGESRAYPKNIMEVHEMVNDTLGGRRIGMPYCTLCGSAQAFFTDSGPAGYETMVLRTSGLLSRSNKVMYELESQSMFDTFLGTAITGPLREAGVVLEQATVVTSTWGAWKAAHPDTSIVASDGGRGISYPTDPLAGRDDNGPIFPVGDVDPRLPVQELVLGVLAADGTAMAFPVALATAAIEEGVAVGGEGYEVVIEAGGLIAVDDRGNQLPTHEAFWFAWSQFHPNTTVWGQ